LKTGGRCDPVLRIIRHERQGYADSVAEQERLVAEILYDRSGPCVILTEHDPVYTIGTSGSRNDVLLTCIDGERIAVFVTGRGGEVTYHGPGQLVCYVLADLRKEQDLHRHVWRLEEMIIRTLGEFDIQATRHSRGIGVWVGGRKIAAVGVRCRKWISYHGIALNIDPNLRHYSGIVPCGMRDSPVTSMRALGINVCRERVEDALLPHAHDLFGQPEHNESWPNKRPEG
jgi:lipoyl(octanoyl) transferase